jgi:hypothetical protein
VSFVSKTTPYLNPDLIFKVFYQASLKYKSTTNVTLALTEKKKKKRYISRYFPELSERSSKENIQADLFQNKKGPFTEILPRS